MKRLLMLIAFLLPVAYAQGFVVSPQAIVVNPRPSFGVEVWLDRDSSGDVTPEYQIGEEVSISVRPAEASYVYLFDVKSTGEITQIFPNRFDTDNHLGAGETRTFPPSGARYVFNIAPPRGLSKVIAVASKTELDTRTLAAFRSESDMFPQSNIGESGFIESFAIIVRPVPQQDWVTDTALYYVGNRPAQAEFGTLRFTSTPDGADVYLDGEFIGYTPLRFGTRPGTHRVRIEFDGYEPFSTSVNLRGGEVLDVNARLQSQARPGTVAFTSSPGGADVYVDGRYVGTTPTGAIRFDDGTYTARFELAGHQTTTVTFRARAGENRSVAASMQAQLGSILVQGNVGGALVFVDGRQVGTLATGSGRFELREVSSGMHEVVVMAPGYATYVTTVSVQPGRSSEVNLRQSRF